MTLEFLGAVDAAMRGCAEQAAQSLSAPVFELEFQRIGYWPRPQVLWSAPARTPDALTGLVSMLRKALVECGHTPEARAFRAHVTLARKVRGPVTETSHAPVRWAVSDFHLIASETLAQGARYRSVACWPLG
jgi:2'-5' RNA ligase